MLIMGNATVPSSKTVPIFSLPPGTAGTLFYTPNPQVTTIYIGTSPNVSSTTGTAISNTPTWMENYVTGKGVTYYATTGNATGSSVQFLLSTGS